MPVPNYVYIVQVLCDAVKELQPKRILRVYAALNPRRTLKTKEVPKPTLRYTLLGFVDEFHKKASNYSSKPPRIPKFSNLYT